MRQYRVLEKLGEGGMGEVYEAFDETLERRVALKVIRSERSLDDLARERFLREARTLSALDHPGVCRIFDYLRTPDGDFLVLELISGRTLHQILAQQPQPSRGLALDLAAQLADVLTAAHAAGVVHRDLKPGNVMRTPAGAVKVLDFGLARRAGPAGEPSVPAPTSQAEARAAVVEPPTADDSPSTSPGTVLGTLHYMSPEQARGEPVTAATDLYAYGLILQELLTHEPGHPRDLGFAELHARVMDGTVHVSPRLDREIGALVRALLSAEPEARPRAAEVLERLRWILGRRGRVLRRALVAGAVLVGGLAWLKYTVDLRRREHQAEDLIDYLVGPLREQLVPLGRLDILADLGRRGLAYFDAVPAEQWTTDELTRRCRAFYQLGDVYSQQGDRRGAMEFFTPALGFAEELVRRTPADPERVFELAQLQFYVGQVSFELQDYENARPYFEAYLESGRRLVEFAPERPEFRFEVAYGLGNLGALALKQADWRKGEGAFEEGVGIWRELVRADPHDLDRRRGLVDALSWWAECLEHRGALARVVELRREELAMREDLHEEAPDDANQEYLRSTCLHHLADVLVLTGNLEQARHQLEEALTLARGLSHRDASNAEWRRHLGVALHVLARELMRAGDLERAGAMIGEAQDVLDTLNDPGSPDWCSERARAKAVEVEILFERGRPREALEAVDRVLTWFPPDAVPLELASRVHCLRGRMWNALSESERARAEFEAGLASLESLPPERRPPTVEVQRTQLLAYLGRRDEAARTLQELELLGVRDSSLAELVKANGIPEVPAGVDPQPAKPAH